MRFRIWNMLRGHLSLSLKCGSILFLFLISVLVVACGPDPSAQVPGAPPVTVTINLDKVFASPTPPLAEYSCGAWATESTPPFAPNAPVQVYAKFLHNVDGNPIGMDKARGHATFYWPSDPPTSVDATTTSDGLAVFSTQMQPSALNHVVQVEVTFASTDGHTCNVTRHDNNAAFFTAIQVSPTVTAPPGDTPPPGGGTPPTCPFPIPNLCKTKTPSPTATP